MAWSSQQASSMHLRQRPSPPGTFHILIRKISYFVIRFLNEIFFLSLTFPISLSNFYLVHSSMVKSDDEIGKVNDKEI
jgi:hypothetical protein